MTTLLGRLEKDLNNWASDWTGSMRSTPYQLVSASSLPFAEDRQRKFNAVFDLRFEFRSLPDAIDHVMCTASLAVVKQAMLKLSSVLSFNHSSVNYALQEKGSSLMKHITNCADSLCMTVPYLCRLDHGKFGAVHARGPLLLASMWYQKINDDSALEKLAWCNRAAKKIAALGIRPYAADDINNES